MSATLLDYKLPARLYRRLLLVTDAWYGDRVSPGSLLIQCHWGGKQPPLFWCGTPDTLVSFFEVLGQQRSVYCMCSTYEVLTPSEDNIQALGRYYAAEIIKTQPQGPYILGGFCEAGLVSYEVARQLEMHGYSVGMLYLFDRDVTEADLWLNMARRAFLSIERFFDRWEQLWKEPGQCLKEILLNKWSQLVADPLKNASATLGITETQQVTETRYSFKPFPGKIHLIFVRFGLLGYFQFSFFQRYWRKLALGGVEFTVIPGRRHNNPSNWSKVAQRFQFFIQRAGI